MIPTKEQIESIARTRRGSLGDVPFAVLLRALREDRRSGVIELVRQQVHKRVILEDGVPVDCQSNLAHEKFGRFLVSIGRLTDAEFASTFSESLTRSVPHGEVLVERGLVKPTELFRLLQQCLAKKLLDIFPWNDAEFSLIDEDVTVSAPLKVNVAQLILTGMTRFGRQEDIDATVMTLVGERLVVDPSSTFDHEELRMPTSHRQLLDAAVAPQSMSELAQASGLSTDELARVVYALGVLGVLIPEQRLAAAPPAKSGSDTQPVAKIRYVPKVETTPEEVMKLFLDHRRIDAFDLLQVSEGATPASIEHKFLDYAQRFAPWAFSTDELLGVQEQAQELFLAGVRAFAELSDDERRADLVKRRNVTEEQKKQAEVGPGRIQTDLLDSEVQYQKGMELKEAGNLDKAIHYLEFASFCDPQNGVYQAEVAHCQFLRNPKEADLLIDRLDEALRIDPKCGLVQLYAGEMAMHLGNFDDAERRLRQANTLLAPDRRAIEKLKELSSVRT
ncbi:MAG: DUF4388 domain-containing protein [Acidobacteriota bacterium]